MPVIPSHTGFAATPNLASSFLGGARISADIAQDAARLQLQRQQLAQEAQQAQMQMQAKEAQAERQALRDQQEMEMEKAYKDAQIGLRQRELQGEEKVLQFKTQEAAQRSMAQQMYQAEARRLMDVDQLPAQEAYQQAALKFGPQMNLNGGAMAAAFRGRGGIGGADGLGPASPLLDQAGVPTGMMQAMSSDRARRIFAPPTSIQSQKAEPVEGTKGQYFRIGERILPMRDQTTEIRAELKKLEEAHRTDVNGRLLAKADPKKKMADTDKLKLEDYRAREKKIAELEEQIRELRAGTAAAPTNAAPKRFVWDQKQKKLVPK